MREAVVVAVVELLAIVFATATWVYLDARAHAGRGRPIVSSYGSINIDTPAAWFLACLVMWETFFPHYIAQRRWT
ncbi:MULTISPECIES: hypothetical protein [Mycobacterium]|uniref:Uncharacterized protein n=1 Tax=Mycobacterium kiyosense TaxID=2871094 RepID=A0A9P3UX16_9MYCO|nr:MULTISPECIES: hypothetical protein [Mycobacterium]BDB43689.1 hypothetical protein IWGMT90018_41350 [Mycobacterium kiyosense]BDE15249.1 hypothetical protein MKCMC460_41090 [Mycobacterium sp. 20KCMC460]GLB83510.1 hypothetical protein SRL2020028_27660 [Mycobacterium kiyosense]GLB91721.1 hypothetical protein SRL2020130_45380 [Mycobacterium kiyosense]GLB99051.1 hypothetical protein SRL2020226_58270 [Mycobacterium kiyosense]